jgi:FkbM family methyltransferase
MRQNGFAPRVIIDGGANVGDWTRMVRTIFPATACHLIEPQPSCLARLRPFVESQLGLTLHPVALTRPGIDRVTMIGGGQQGGGTGAWVAEPGESLPDAIDVPARTLDDLFAATLTLQDRTLLKLDLEGHEITALEGASQVLPRIEVIFTEVQFFAIHDNGRPTFSDMLPWLRERGFELYDFACLAARPRDQRLRMGDVIFVRKDSPLLADKGWE